MSATPRYKRPRQYGRKLVVGVALTAMGVAGLFAVAGKDIAFIGKGLHYKFFSDRSAETYNALVQQGKGRAGNRGDVFVRFGNKIAAAFEEAFPEEVSNRPAPSETETPRP